jgi:hypothetical protein
MSTKGCRPLRRLRDYGNPEIFGGIWPNLRGPKTQRWADESAETPNFIKQDARWCLSQALATIAAEDEEGAAFFKQVLASGALHREQEHERKRAEAIFRVGLEWPLQFRRHRTLPDWRITPAARYSKGVPIELPPQRVRAKPGPKPRAGRALTSTERSRIRRARLRAAAAN